VLKCNVLVYLTHVLNSVIVIVTHNSYLITPNSVCIEDGAVLPMASVVLRWVMILWILAQVVIFCGALDPVHIQLDLDGKKTDNKNDQTKYDKLKEISDLVKIWFNAQNPDEPTYNNPAQRDLVEKAGLKKLYVRGTFQIKEYGGGDRAFLWDNGKRGAKELGEFILKIFKDGTIVIVVFPGDLQTYTGFQFRKEFEEVVQKPNGKITVGRGVINVYLEEERDFTKNENYYRIFANYHLNTFSFSPVFTAWRTELNPVNIFQVKIQEADSVVVRLVTFCSSDQNGLKVGSHKEQGLADIVFKLLRVQDVETHPKQKIRVELPEQCGTPQEREAYTGRLVDRLKERNLNVYGKEPSVHIQLYRNQRADDEFHKDVDNIKKSHPQDIVGEIKDDKVVSQVTDQERKAISSAKELFLHIHCHGVFYGKTGTICGEDPKALSDILFKFIETLLDKSAPKNGFIKFHVCKAGSEKGQKYVIDFLTKFDQKLQKHQITIQDSLSYKYETSQIEEYTQVMVPLKTLSDTDQMYVNEKHAFGRFTVRTMKTSQGYKAFPVLPLTEYKLIYKE
ncbi:hypothetical protein NFI96_009040, partial [Prochilodus magdalenae]